MKEFLFKNTFITIFILLFMSFSLNSYAQDSSKVKNTLIDSLHASDTAQLFVPASQFTYAGNKRYTIDGSLPLLKTKFRPATASVIGGIYLGTLVWLHFHQQNAWWSNNRSNFHFEEDWSFALQVDKAGHFYGGYLTSYFLSEGLIASGVNWDDANIYGSAFAILYQTYVETEDGFARDWGFSPSDWYFDALGPVYFLAQHFVPVLQNITPKWQYIPSEWTGKPKISRPRTFIDDYNSSTFWYSVKLYNIIPKSMEKYWLPWLNVAVGYGADAIDAQVDPNNPPDQLAHRRFVIGLDYDLVSLLPEGGHFWNWFRQTLNYIKLPAPAVEFSSGKARFYILYPFQINLGGIHF
ncbi:MAG: YfiM family protein [Bacteroidetes bacterium]|nr:YfiM family protein [Bacteroidota bacterium]